MADLEDFIQAEKNKRNWWSKFFDALPVIEETKAIAQFAKTKRPGYQTTINPSVSLKIATVPVIGFLLLLLVLFIKAAFTEQISWVVIVVVVFLLPAIIYASVYDTFFDKEKLFTIVIDDTGIACGNTVYEWPDVIETYIISVYRSKTTDHSLLIHSKTMGFTTYNLRKFNIGIRKLSALIEYYKTNAALNQLPHAITPHTI